MKIENLPNRLQKKTKSMRKVKMSTFLPRNPELKGKFRTKSQSD